MTGVSFLQRAAFAVCVAASITSTPAQAQDAGQTVNLTPSQLRNLAANTLQDGNAAGAATAAEFLLNRFPDDATTLLIRAEAAVLLGDFESTKIFARRAFWNATSNAQRFSAARLTALGHAQLTEDNLAMIWLRVARQNAPTEAASEVVAREFQAIRQRNPLSVNLRFGITPSTNINGGSENEVADLAIFGQLLPFNLSEDAQALSGWEYSTNLNLRYRVRADDTSATFLNFGLSGRTYSLTEGSLDRARESDPDIKGSDFSDATVSFGVTHRFVLAPDANVTDVSLSYARTFQQDDNERRFVTASISHAFDVGQNDRLRLSSFFQRQERIENGDEAQAFDLAATYITNVEGIGQFSFGIGARDNLAEDPAEDFDSRRVNIGFSPGNAFQGVNFGFSASYEERDFENVPIIGGPRNDEITSFGVRAVFSEVELFGFRPVVTFDRTRQESNSNLFDRNFTTVGFDIVSSF